jgi:hypothetical protein
MRKYFFLLAILVFIASVKLQGEGISQEGRILNHALAYIQLPLNPEESKIIGEIIETVGNTYWAGLAVKQWSLREKEKKIKHVHPLRFLGEIFSNANLKSCMRKIEKSSLKWGGFMKGLTPNMEKEFKCNNLLQYVDDFCQAVKADPDKVKIYIQKNDWTQLIKYLINV